ncbi:S-adenosyl-L-methionine-dependent methyltransferase [Pluteus cervinus]|uniref:S-adenosyl-L-methionine-dependent methyltransferase n=1 Tax=Pluteus cervinus TaxID=181527 RepID=A0ACD3ACG2_9AGAR|nr:S-adenosyl-L-methionine-dependent methyltransferase [Pluteus cervinus]
MQNTESEMKPPAAKRPRLDEGIVAVGEPQTPQAILETPQETIPNQKAAQQPPGAQKSGKKSGRAKQDVLWHDIQEVLGKDVVDKVLEAGKEFEAPFKFKDEITVEIKAVGSGGEGVGVIEAHDEGERAPWCVIVPFTLPGEKVRAKVYRNARLHSYADLVEVVQPNTELRDMTRVKCQYFGECAGCQYQMLAYDSQLDLKRSVVVKAYQNFSDLPQSVIPSIGSTIGSPLQYNYRTKITPHFDAPPKKARAARTAKESAETDVNMNEETIPDWLNIGFNKIGTRKVMDIEDCPIATPVIRNALKPAREAIRSNIWSYKKGVSLLFRDSLDRSVEIPEKPLDSSSLPEASSSVDLTLSEAFNNHVCITDHNATVREKVGDAGWVFEYTAGSFFQNNNSVLGPLTRYVRDAIFAPWGGIPSTTTDSTTSVPSYDLPTTGAIAPLSEATKPTHLVDAYCGSGLFSITLSPYFDQIAGIELSTASIASATRNVQINHALYPSLMPSPTKCQFLSGDASNIFAVVREKTVLVIDPPRKGCDEKFINQVIDWGCQVVVYVSCNVHTQARDVGQLIKGMEKKGEGKTKYVLESVRGFDLFPQTAHVESVAVLRLVETS